MSLTARTLAALTLGALVLAAPASALAQFAMPSGDAIYVSGKGEFAHRADRLRLTLQLEGRAASMAEALERLKQREQKARQKLEVLEADPESIKIGAAKLPAELSAQRNQMMQMFQQQTRGRRGGQAFKMPEMAVVRKELVAEWDLPDAQGDSYLLACHELKTAIAEADISDAANPDPIPAEVEEMLEEFAEMSNQYGMEPDDAGTGAQFVYLCKLTEDQRANAMSQAFADAKLQASEMAAAAGVTLGAVSLVHADETPYDMAYQYMGYGTPRPPQAGPLEAVSTQPGDVTYTVNLNVAFRVRQQE